MNKIKNKNISAGGEKLRIGINASFLRKPTTGIGQVTLNFLKNLSEAKIQSSKRANKEVEFILYLEEDPPAKLNLPKEFSRRFFLPIWKRDDLIRKIWWEKFCLPRQAKKDKCDVFLSLYQCPTVIKSIPHIMLVHDIIPEIFPQYQNNARKTLYWKLTRRAIKKADKIIAVSKRTEKDLIQILGIKGEKIAVSYIDVDEIYKKKVAPKESARVIKKYKLQPGYILAGGGMEVRKNVEGVMRAYKILKKEKAVPSLPKLVIYGKLMPELFPLATDAEKLARELNLTRQVKLLGMVPQKDLPALFSNAAMFVYPSHYEGFGMPVLEAMNTGTPVVASKKASLPEVGWDSVLYCNPDDARDIAMVMKNVLTRESLRQTLSTRARDRAKQFSWKKFVKKFLNIIESLN